MNAGLDFASARSNMNMVGTDFCYICFQDCFQSKTIILRIDQFEFPSNHKNENICLSCMNKYLRSFFKLTKDGNFDALFAEIEAVQFFNQGL